MNHWSAVKALVYKELRLSQMETIAALAAWPVIIGCYIVSRVAQGRLMESEAWSEFGDMSPYISSIICGAAVMVFGLREIMSDATVRESVFFHALPCSRRMFWGIKLGCGLARYLVVALVAVMFSMGLQTWFTHRSNPLSNGWIWAACFQVCLVIWYLACFLATVRVDNHWVWRAMVVLGGLALSFTLFTLFMVIGTEEGWLSWQYMLAAVAILVGICVVYEFAILHVVRYRDLS
jgi:hypothetical protein